METPKAVVFLDLANGGRFFDTDDPAAIRDAVISHTRDALDASPERLREGMAAFSRERFRERISAIIQTVVGDA